MSVVCPQGHSSTEADYCSVCGDRIGGEVAAAPPAPSAGAAPPAPAAPPPAGGKACPNCQTDNLPDARYCEGCGLDFTSGVAPAPGVTAPSPAPGAAAPPTPPAPAPVAAAWEVVVTADRAYYDRNADGDVPFPVVAPERHFPLTGTRALIGRRSASKGVTPEIDLSTAPRDDGVSHVHAVLISAGDGWEIVDPGSSNGTFLNDGAEPLPLNQPHPLGEGDEVHLGRWTTVTLRRLAP